MLGKSISFIVLTEEKFAVRSIPGLPVDDQPIILLVEQTEGGYAKITTVISSGLPLVAQTTPGDTLRFESVDLNTAHGLVLEQKNRIKGIKQRVEVF